MEFQSKSDLDLENKRQAHNVRVALITTDNTLVELRSGWQSGANPCQTNSELDRGKAIFNLHSLSRIVKRKDFYAFYAL